MRCLVEQRADYQRPTYSRDDFYRSLAGVVPNFIAEIVALDTAKRRGRTAAPTPLPLVIVGDDEALAAMFPGGDPDPFTPLGAAYLWLVALRAIDEFRPTLETLSVNPAAWHGYSAIVETLNGWYLTQNIVYSVEAPDQLAFAKLIPGSGSSMRAFGDAPLTEVRFLTMVRQSDRWWRVWGLTDGWTPSAADVLR
jgi:hypothetical protein